MKKSYIFWGAILILAGCIFFLYGKNMLPGNPLDYLWQVFLILLGVWIIINSQWKRKNFDGEIASIALNGANQSRIQINHGAGRININSGTNRENLLTYSSVGTIQHYTSYDGNNLDVRLSPTSNILPFVGLGEGFNWDLRLNNEIPIILIIETGACNTYLNLIDLKITELKLSTGASKSTIILPSTIQKSNVLINAGVASLDIHIPKNIKARIRIKEGLTSLSIDKNHFVRSGVDTYHSIDFNKGEYQTDIKIESGVGSITIH